MYEKFETKKEYIISNRLYFKDKWYLEKEIISTWCFHPIFKKLVNFKIHIGELFPENYEIINREFKNGKLIEEKEIISLKNRLSNEFGRNNLVSIDFTNELNKYIPEPDVKQEIDTYVYIETFQKGIKIPDYYSLILFDADFDFDNCSINKQNDCNLWFFSSDKFFEKMGDRLIPDYIYNAYLSILDRFNELINDYFLQKKIQLQEIIYLNKELNAVKQEQSFMYQYSSDVINSFVDYICSKKIALKCEYCGQIMQYAENKKYCSFKIDEQDCGKKARNKRTYEKRKIEISNSTGKK